MFNKNDHTLLVIRIIINVVCIAGAILGVIAGIVLSALGAIEIGLPILFCLPFLCWIGWLIGRISLTFMADVKFIRNKLYELDNSYLGVFLANRTSVAPSSSAAPAEGGFDYAAVAQQLMQLKALLDDGTITQEEFDREKAKLLKN